jgi:general stress protein 26
MSTNAQTDDQKKLASLIKGISIAMLTTRQPDETLRSRPMQTQELEFDGDLWFFTHESDPKVDEARQNEQVNLSYGDPAHNRYVSVSGEATVVRDAAKNKELWNPAYKAFFPKGLDDPDLALLKVRVTQAEYWDAPSNTFVLLAGFVKATATGQEFHPGENEKLTLAR